MTELLRVVELLYAREIDYGEAAKRTRALLKTICAAPRERNVELAAAAYVMARSYKIPPHLGRHDAVNQMAWGLARKRHLQALAHGELDGLIGDILVRRALEKKETHIRDLDDDSVAMENLLTLLARVEARQDDPDEAEPELRALVSELVAESRARIQLAEAAYVYDRAQQWADDKYIRTLDKLALGIENGEHLAALERGDLAEALAHIRSVVG